MRYLLKPRRPLPKPGTLRDVTRFLWLPKIMTSADTGVRELRWLCRATWRQIYTAEYADEFGGYAPAGWVDFGPFRKPCSSLSTP